jgi:hypothetical protein
VIERGVIVDYLPTRAAWQINFYEPDILGAVLFFRSYTSILLAGRTRLTAPDLVLSLSSEGKEEKAG